MNLRVVYHLTGYLSIAVGALAAASVYRPMFTSLATGISIVGIILSGVNIFLNLKYFSVSDTFPKGYIGVFLSLLPVLFVVYMTVQSRR